MEWVTVYEAGRFNGIIEFKIGIPALIIGILLVLFYLLIRYIENDKDDSAETLDEEFISVKYVAVMLGVILVIFGCIFTGKGIYGLINSQYVEDSFYEENHHLVIEGIPKNCKGHRGSYDFSIDDMNFVCWASSGVKRREKIEWPFERGVKARVFYKEQIYDEYHNEYEVVRIDVWDAADE